MENKMIKIYEIDNKTIGKTILLISPFIIIFCIWLLMSIYLIFVIVLFVIYFFLYLFFTYKKLEIDDKMCLIFTNRYIVNKTVKLPLMNLMCVQIFRKAYIIFIFNNKKIRMLINKNELLALKNNLTREDDKLTEKEKIKWIGDYKNFTYFY